MNESLKKVLNKTEHMKERAIFAKNSVSEDTINAISYIEIRKEILKYSFAYKTLGVRHADVMNHVIELFPYCDKKIVSVKLSSVGFISIQTIKNIFLFLYFIFALIVFIFFSMIDHVNTLDKFLLSSCLLFLVFFIFNMLFIKLKNTTIKFYKIGEFDE